MAVNAEEKRITELTDFSITDCGAMDRLMMRLGISRPPDARYLVRRAVLASLLAWLPLLAIGMMSREALLRWRSRLLATGSGGKVLMGVMLVAIGALILTGLDKRIEAVLVEASPAWLTELTTRF